MSVTTPLTGESTGRFHSLHVKNNSGAFENILTLVGSGGGGGGGAGLVQSVQAPLSVDGSGDLSVDLNNYALTSALTSGLAGKADQTAMTTALAAKADQSAMTTALAAKADNTALAAKADQSAMTTALAAKADQSATTTALAAKADQSAMTTALAAKADQSTMNTALAAKADQSAMTTALAAKADQSAMTTALTAKQDNITATAPLYLANNVMTVDLTPYATTNELALKAANFQVASPITIDASTSPRTLQLDTSNLSTSLASTLVARSAIFNNSTGPSLKIADSGGTFKTLANDSGSLAWGGDKLFVPSQFSVSPGLTAVTSDSLGIVSISMDNNFRFSDLKLIDPATSSVTSLTHASGALKWDNFALATESFATNLLTSNVTVGGDLTVEGGDITLSTATISGNYGLPVIAFHTGQVNFLSFGHTVTSSGSNNDTQALRITRTGAISSTSSITTHSDASIKTEVSDLDPAAAQALFDSVTPKRYKRTDREQDKWRVGFLAQDLESSLAPNLVGTDPAEGLKTLDYARLNCILWQVCKNLQARITALESKKRKA